MASFVEFASLTTPTAVVAPLASYTAFADIFAPKIDDVTPRGTPNVVGHFIDDNGDSRLERPVTDPDPNKRFRVDVSQQKQLFVVGLAGLINNNTAYLDKALAAILAGLAYRNTMTINGVVYDPAHEFEPGEPYGPDGSFPAQKFGTFQSMHKMHNKWMFCENSARFLYAFVNSAYYTGARATTADTCITQLGEVAAWCLSTNTGTGDLLKFYKGTTNVNQLCRVATGFHLLGLLTGETDYTDQARTRYEDEIFSPNVAPGQDSRHISEDGVYKEKRETDGIGFDFSYQTVSLENVFSYRLGLDPGTWRDTVDSMLALGYRRLLANTKLSSGGRTRGGTKKLRQRSAGLKPGTINDRDNTRTIITDIEPGLYTGTYDSDIVCTRFRQPAYLGLNSAIGYDMNFLADVSMKNQHASWAHDDDDDGL